MKSIPARIAEELQVKEQQIQAAIGLLDEGATVPFISRYRKEVTGGLDDTQMRNLEERLHYLREMEDRRKTILDSIREQEKLTPELEKAILEADTKTRLEDLYLPYKPKRRTKGQIAVEAGLEPLADALLSDPSLDPNTEAAKYLNEEHKIAEAKDALDGAKYILMERFAEDADLLAKLRERLSDEAHVFAKVMTGKENEGAKYRDYFEYDELLKKVPSHRALAIFRGRNEGILSISVDLKLDEDAAGKRHPLEILVARHWKVKDQGHPADSWLAEVVRWTWRVKLHSHLETDLLGELRERAEEDAIQVFAHNLKDLLLAAPAGPKATIGLDPGLRTGVKVAVVDSTGKVLDHGAIFPTPPQNRTQEAEAQLVHWCKKHGVELIAIGNGTASRETDAFVGQVLKNHPELKVQKVMVNESGASVYSASEFAAQEFPNLDVTIRGAISIARRLQDPLAELVKIEPKSIGVGQYQHDVSPTKLTRSLGSVVEDCVNAVGVDVNTASAPLLTRVSGLNKTLAANIVSFRDQNGAFKSREQLKSVPRFGDKTFEQAAGFLRVANDENPLDASAVHPESYRVVERIAKNNGRELRSLIGDSSFLKSLKPQEYVDETFGLPTIMDILQELDKPGRDPRPEFKTAQFKEGVEKISDLSEGMVLEGTVTNVTNFGAFVDIGVHQDGLVHISALSESFVKDPREVVKAGDIVKVKVMEVDEQRKRIGLSMRMGDEPGQAGSRGAGTNDRNNAPRRGGNPKGSGGKRPQPMDKQMGTMGALLQQALKKDK
ncbi:RNA-binding transcriptional accessory protein [Proteobacteria bacterium 005FR1]|nr:RNA-binding transcriptional accessory protein [Proteobacteria bacterium 005FR1]